MVSAGPTDAVAHVTVAGPTDAARAMADLVAMTIDAPAHAAEEFSDLAVASEADLAGRTTTVVAAHAAANSLTAR